jgi:hypothetical protein
LFKWLTILTLLPLFFCGPACGQVEASPDTEIRSTGIPLPLTLESRPLSLSFLERRFLAEWVRVDLAGKDCTEISGKWGALHRERLGDELAPDWDLTRRNRGVCLYDQRRPGAGSLLAFCDSLDNDRLDVTSLIREGVCQGYLLERAGRETCGGEGDPAERLLASLGKVPRRSLRQLKEGMEYAAIFFAAERQVEQFRLQRQERVLEFLEQPGQLVSLKYGFYQIESLEPHTEPQRVDDEYVIYPAGLHVEWDNERSLDVKDLAVLHNTTQHLFQIKEHMPGIILDQGDEEFFPQFGEFMLEGKYQLSSAHIKMVINRGRYRRTDDELRIWWPDSFLSANRNGFLMAAVILIASLLLIFSAQRKRRELAKPIKVKRPRIRP